MSPTQKNVCQHMSTATSEFLNASFFSSFCKGVCDISRHVNYKRISVSVFQVPKPCPRMSSVIRNTSSGEHSRPSSEIYLMMHHPKAASKKCAANVVVAQITRAFSTGSIFRVKHTFPWRHGELPSTHVGASAKTTSAGAASEIYDSATPAPAKFHVHQ